MVIPWGVLSAYESSAPPFPERCWATNEVWGGVELQCRNLEATGLGLCVKHYEEVTGRGPAVQPFAP